jgi:IS5 family transposase
MYHSLDRLTTPLFPELFPFGGTLRADNDWIKLAGLIPWEELEAVYRRYFCPDRGRPAKECQLICGLLIAKHRESLSDRRVVKLLAENPYVQFFCGFDQFVAEEKIIHPSLLSKIRKRLGREFFALFEGEVLRVLMEHDLIRAKEQLVDATVVPAAISYPTDCKLLNEAREWLCRTILRVKRKAGIGEQVRTYRRVGKWVYMAFTKRRKKTKRYIRKVQGQMLRFVRRNLRQIEELLERVPDEMEGFREKVAKKVAVIGCLYAQQKEMWEKRVKRVENRIVSIHRPQIRPMVRGKDGKDVEFGPKVMLSVVDGCGFLDHFSFDAYNESGHLEDSVERYKDRFGQKPKVVIADNIFGSRENRRYLKGEKIGVAFKPLGRPRGQPDKKEKAWMKRQQKKRNRIEGAIGTSKTRYGLDRILYSIPDGEEIWVRMGLMGMNLNRAVVRMT